MPLMMLTATARRTQPVVPSPAARPALILVGHGSRRPGALDGIAAHAAALGRSGRFAEVHVAALRGGGDEPAAVLARVTAPRAFVVPVMMCDGQTARRDLPSAFSALGGASGGALPELIHCPPIGTDPGLAALIAERAGAAARAAGHAPEAVGLLLIGHGSSRVAASAAATRLQAERLAAGRRFARVAVAFLEQEPRLEAVLRAAAGPVIAAGLFAGAGQHATEDVAAALAASGARDVRYLGPIGADAGIARLILAIVARAAVNADLRPAAVAAPARSR